MGGGVDGCKTMAMKVVKRVGQGRRVSKNKYHSAQVEDGVLLEDLGSNLFQIINEEVHCTRHTTFAPEPRQQSNWLFHRYSLSNILAVWWRNYDWWWLLDLITKKKKEKKRDEKRRKYDCQQKEGLLQRSRQSNQPSIFFRPFPSQTSHQCTHATARTHTSLRMLGVEHRERERERRGGTVLTANDQWWQMEFIFSVSPPTKCDPSVPFRCSRLFAMQPGQQWCFWKAAAKDAVAEGRRQRVTDVDSCKKWGDDSFYFYFIFCRQPFDYNTFASSSLSITFGRNPKLGSAAVNLFRAVAGSKLININIEMLQKVSFLTARAELKKWRGGRRKRKERIYWQTSTTEITLSAPRETCTKRHPCINDL